MATEKIFLSSLVLLLFNFTIKDDYKQNKYNQTSYNFLDTNVVNKVSIKDAIDYVIQLTEGDVTKAEKKFKKDIPVWKIELITKQKGVIEFEISAEDKSLIRIDADEGPFEYEINISTDKNILTYSAARKIAEDFTGQKTLKWNFFTNKTTKEYDFWLFTKSGKAQVRVDAEAGEIISTKRKK